MTEQLIQPTQRIKESPAVKGIFDRLDMDGKKLFLGMSHFAPETGGTKEAILTTCAMNEKKFQKAAEQLNQAGLFVRGKIGIVRQEILIKRVDINNLERVLNECLEKGLLNQEEADSVRGKYKAHVGSLRSGDRIHFSIPAKKGFIEDPEGDRYGLKRYKEIQKFLKESGISSR